jgi:hypothetical protein
MKIRTDYPFMDEIHEDYQLLVKEDKITGNKKIIFVCSIHNEYEHTLL